MQMCNRKGGFASGGEIKDGLKTSRVSNRAGLHRGHSLDRTREDGSLRRLGSFSHSQII